ncbi:MAG: hypothetical protein ACK56I_19370, partial [bacterium]
MGKTLLRTPYLQLWENRLELYEESRRMMEFEKMKIKFAKAIKWDLVRKKRSELLKIQNEIIERNHRGEVLIHRAKFFLVVFR